jgi:hypothetical protein
MSPGLEKLPPIQLLLLLLKMLFLILLLLKTKLLPNLPRIWRGLLRGKKILLKIFLWSKRVKSFSKARTLLPLSLPSTKVSIRPIGESC